MVNVLWVDPGETNGWVLIQPIHRLQIRVLEWGETSGPVEFGQWVQRRSQRGDFDFCGCENWVPYEDRKRTWEPAPIHVIGMMRLIFGDRGVFLGQLASDAHAWGTEGKVAPYRDNHPFVGRGGKGHALMALRHALNWTANHWNGIQ